jgi:uncharacterized membrane protein YtjA (UPF0391 family)
LPLGFLADSLILILKLPLPQVWADASAHIAENEGGAMLYYALVFLVIALIAGFLGFGGVAFAAAGIAKILFFIFLVIFVVTLLAHLLRGGTAS